MNQTNDRQLEYETKLIKLVVIILACAAAVAVIWLFFRRIIIWFLPFIIAWLVATAIEPFVRFFEKNLHFPRRIASFIFVVSAVLLLCFIVFAGGYLAVKEAGVFLQNLSSYRQSFSDFIDNIGARLSSLLSFLPRGNTAQSIFDSLLSSVSGGASWLIASATQFFSAVPSVFLFVIVTTISAYLLSANFMQIKRFLILQISAKHRQWLFDVQHQVLFTIGNYIKAYAIILLITFALLLMGFMMLGMKNSLSLAVLVAFVDILPVLGVGIVLIPWAIFSFIVGDTATAVAIALLYAVIAVTRQIIEPHIIGKRTGLHPLVTVIALYIGFNVMGFFGMILFPFIMIIIKYLNDSGKLRLWKQIPDERAGYEKRKIEE